MTDDGGCDECPQNTYNPRFDDTDKACTPCPDNKISPPGSSSAADCKEKGRQTKNTFCTLQSACIMLIMECMIWTKPDIY